MIDPRILYRLHSAPDAGTDPLVILVCDKDTAVMEGAAGAAGRPQTDARFPGLSSLRVGPAEAIVAGCEAWHQIAVWAGRPVYALAVDSDDLDLIGGVGPLKREDFRSLYRRVSDTELGLLARAIQIVDWHATSRFCPACGAPTAVPEAESVARCPGCGHDQYPRHAPAMIVAVVRDGKLLLGQSPRFKGAFHSVLAGFVEPGESVEDCVHREVFEEAAVLVKNLRYFGSQSWPFPHSLMLAFTAEWAGGEIRIDHDELLHAEWYAPDELPPVPSELSISGRLIRWFTETCG